HAHGRRGAALRSCRRARHGPRGHRRGGLRRRDRVRLRDALAADVAPDAAHAGDGVRSARLLVVAACVLATSGYLRLLAATDVVPRAPHLAALPLEIGEWRGEDAGRLDRDTESILQADDYVVRTYARGGLPVSLFVA